MNHNVFSYSHKDKQMAYAVKERLFAKEFSRWQLKAMITFALCFPLGIYSIYECIVLFGAMRENNELLIYQTQRKIRSSLRWSIWMSIICIILMALALMGKAV